MFRLHPGDQVGIVACSDALPRQEEGRIRELSRILTRLGLVPVFSDHIFEPSGTRFIEAGLRADALMRFYADPSIKAIFDISGGNLANELLPLLDYPLIKGSQKPFWGYSDLSTIINAIYTMTGNTSYLFQVKTLTWEHGGQQELLFQQSLLEGKDALYRVDWDFVQGEHMEGVVIGGNTRCFLKLAGTPYMPDFSDKILFLESLGGGKPELITYLNQLKQMGPFKKYPGCFWGRLRNSKRKKARRTSPSWFRRPSATRRSRLPRRSKSGMAANRDVSSSGRIAIFAKRSLWNEEPAAWHDRLRPEVLGRLPVSLSEKLC